MNDLAIQAPGLPVERLPSGKRPQKTPLEGARVRLEPLDAERHAASLYALSHGGDNTGRVWTYLPYGPFADAGEMHAWIEGCAQTDDPLFFAVIDKASGQASGMASYLRIAPTMGVIEIGHIWFAPSLQKTTPATEAIYLLARHAFDDLEYRRLEWKCNALNEASRRAALRFGLSFEGIFRQHMIVKGRNRDSAWYALLDGDWPRVRANFECWLSPDNFDPQGRQRRALSELNRP